MDIKCVSQPGGLTGTLTTIPFHKISTTLLCQTQPIFIIHIHVRRVLQLVGWFWCKPASLFNCQFPLNQASSIPTIFWWVDGAVTLEMAQVSSVALTEQEVTAVLCFVALTSPWAMCSRLHSCTHF